MLRLCNAYSSTILGPLLIPSPELVAAMPLSPGVHFSRRRPSLGLGPNSNSIGSKRGLYGATLDPTNCHPSLG